MKQLLLVVILAGCGQDVGTAAHTLHSAEIGCGADAGPSGEGEGDGEACPLLPPLAPHSVFDADAPTASPVTAWPNAGTSGLGLTQASTTRQPTLAPCLGSHACVSSDGGDWLGAASAADWQFLHDGSGATVYVVASVDNPGDASVAVVQTRDLTGTAAGVLVGVDNRVVRGSSVARLLVGSNVLDTSAKGPDDTLSFGAFHVITVKVDDDGAAGVDGFVRVDGVQVMAEVAAKPFTLTAPALPLRVGGQHGLTAAVLIYASAHTTAEMQQVEDYLRCHYGLTTAPPTPHLAPWFGDSLAAARPPVVEYPAKVRASDVLPFEVDNRAVRGHDTLEILADFHAFDVGQQQPYAFLTINGGTNDVYDGSQTVAQAFVNLNAIWDESAARTGFLVATTVPAFSTATSAQLAAIADLNALIVSSSKPDAVLDLHTIWAAPGMLGSDGIHPTEAGTQAAADAWLALTGL